MTTKGVKPEQGQLYAQAMTLVRELDLEHLRRFYNATNTLIILRKALRVSKKKKRE